MRHLLLIGCLALAACGGGPRPHPLAIPSPFQLDAPFHRAEQNDELIGSVTEAASVVIEPIDGLSGPFNAALMRDVSDAAQAQDVPLSPDVETRSAERLRGRFSAWIARNDGLMGTVIWRLESEDGELIDSFETNAPMRTYSEWDDSVFDVENAGWRQAIAEETALLLRAAMDERPMIAQRVQAPSELAASQGPPILVPQITGAPGDGNLSLTRSVRALLEQQSINIVDPAYPPEGFEPQAAYTLRGGVAMGEAYTGAQSIAISWDLYGPDGRHLGNVAQQTEVAPGALDGPWGEVAIYAAMGAVEGIMTLLTVIPENGR